ncbi:MAG: 4-hydroxybenzoate octaprenyltransferase [Thiotrichales bacterium]
MSYQDYRYRFHPRHGVLGRLQAYARLIRLDKPIGTLLLLWPTLWALWIAAEGVPDWHILAVFVAGVALMRSAGCAINDYADRDFDPHVSRTRQRPLAAHEIQPFEALLVAGTLALIAFALVLTLNRPTLWMAVGAVLLAASYPFMKRYHYMPQVHLGVAFAWAIPMAFTAQTGALPTQSGWLLFLAAVLWTTAYDTMYAMVDRDDDLKIGIKSTAILFGDADRVGIALLQAMMFMALIFVGRLEQLGWAYYVGLVIAAVLALYQQFLIRERRPSDCMRAFLNNNSLGLVIFIGLALERWLAARIPV